MINMSLCAPIQRQAQEEAAAEQNAVDKRHNLSHNLVQTDLPEEFVDPRLRDPAVWQAMDCRAKVQALCFHVARCAVVMRAPLQLLIGTKYCGVAGLTNEAARDPLPSWFPEAYRHLTAGWEDKMRQLADLAATRMAASASNGQSSGALDPLTSRGSHEVGTFFCVRDTK
jgi:hypothetical protein